MNCMCWMHVSCACAHVLSDGAFVPFKTFQKCGSSPVTASVSLCLKGWSVASSRHYFHRVTALNMPLKRGLFGAFCWFWGVLDPNLPVRWKGSRCFPGVCLNSRRDSVMAWSSRPRNASIPREQQAQLRGLLSLFPF